MSDIQVRTVAERLSDGSYVYNVVIDNVVTLHAVDVDAANKLRDGIRHAINLHTVDVAHALSSRLEDNGRQVRIKADCIAPHDSTLTRYQRKRRLIADFTDSILEALSVDVLDESRDSPSDQADLALAEIERLQRIEKELCHAILVFTDTADRDRFIDRVHVIADDNKRKG